MAEFFGAGGSTLGALLRVLVIENVSGLDLVIIDS